MKAYFDPVKREARYQALLAEYDENHRGALADDPDAEQYEHDRRGWARVTLVQEAYEAGLAAVAASGSPPSPPRAWRESPAVMEKFRAIRLDDTMSDELDLAELLDCATALVAVGAAPLAQPTPPPAVTREGRSAQQ